MLQTNIINSCLKYGLGAQQVPVDDVIPKQLKHMRNWEGNSTRFNLVEYFNSLTEMIYLGNNAETQYE